MREDTPREDPRKETPERPEAEPLPDQALGAAAGGCKPMPKYPPKGLA